MNNVRGPAPLLLGGAGVTMLTAGAVLTARGLRGKGEIRRRPVATTFHRAGGSP